MQEIFRIKTDIPAIREVSGCILRLFHHEGDDDHVLRLNVETDEMRAQLFPSKGLSVGNVSFDGCELFWDQPIDLVDPDKLDLWGNAICINGEPAPGFAFLETLASGVELYGLKNWGMPTRFSDGKLGLLHGETSNIPVKEIVGYKDENVIVVEAEFIYRSFEGDDPIWYERGKSLFKVIKRVILNPSKKKMVVRDVIENISSEPMIPDWGYHITLKPEVGSRFIVPSQWQMTRGGNSLPADIQTWMPAEDDKIRTEVGIIHRKFEKETNELGERIVSEMVYPDGRKILIGVPPSPYFQTWFCHGGAYTNEFTYKDGSPVFKRNWDGQGIEIGSSALDHDGNVDPDVPKTKALAPGESIEIVIDFQVMS